MKAQRFVLGNFNVVFCTAGIKVANQLYRHKEWQNFTHEFMRQTMSGEEIRFWSDHRKHLLGMLKKRRR